jgi:hypothetical protein
MKLETSQELLDRIRAKYDLSWYGLIDLMQVHKNTVYSWKANHTTVDKRYVLRIAELLDDSPHYVLACLEAERDPDHAKLWKEIAAKFRSNAASILLAGVVLVGLEKPMSAEAYAPPAEGDAPVCILWKIARRKLRRQWTEHCGTGGLKALVAMPLQGAIWTWARIRSMGSVPSSSWRLPAPT